MKIFFIIISVIILLLCILQGYRVFLFGKISQKLVEEAKPYSVKVKNPAGRFLVLGDSLGVGVGSNQEESFSGRLHMDFPNIDIYNKSVSGAKISDGLRTLESLGTTTRYNIIFIQLGDNDIIRFTSKSKALINLRELLLKAHEISDQVVFITSGSVGYAPLFIEPFSTFYTLRSKSFFEGFEKVAKDTDTKFISLFFSKDEDLLANNPNLYYAADKLHPSGKGYGEWFKIIKEAFKK